MFSNIDRALVNSTWMHRMAQLEVMVMDPVFSDHSSVSIEVHDQGRRMVRSFKFLNCLAEHKDFIPKVAEGWKTGT